MNPVFASRIAAAAGLLAVALGAFGAHALKHLLAQNGTATIWETAVFYHFIHAVMLFVLAERKVFPAFTWWSFLAGILIFSGSLYLLAANQGNMSEIPTKLSCLGGESSVFFPKLRQSTDGSLSYHKSE